MLLCKVRGAATVEAAELNQFDTLRHAKAIRLAVGAPEWATFTVQDGVIHFAWDEDLQLG